VTLSPPTARVVPFTESTAEAVEPETIAAADPSVTPPAVKVTLPTGPAEPVTVVISAVNCVVALWAILAGFAVSAKVVPIAAGALAQLTAKL
jgi:hypothetical protein